MRIKRGTQGASISGIRPESVIGMLVALSLFNELEQPFELSSGLEGKHGRNSLHFVGLAFDVTTRGIDQRAHAEITKHLVDRLGDEFDVVYEQSHWHIEFQPENRKP